MSKPPVFVRKTGGFYLSGETWYILIPGGDENQGVVAGQLHGIVRVSLHTKQKIGTPKRGFRSFGPSGETRTRGILVPNQAPYQLGHTRILS